MVAVLEVVRIDQVQAFRMLNSQIVDWQDDMPCLGKEGAQGEVVGGEPPRGIRL
jgi:hypothetical protein